VSPKTEHSPRQSGTGANSTADRAIEILLLFTQDQPVWTHQEISAHFEMPRSTTYRYLTSLRSNALIVQDGRGSFSLGPRLLHMAQVARLGNPVLSVAAEKMQDLAEKFQEVVVLNERVGQEIIALDRIESPQRIVLKSTRTHLLPWPATGSAKVLLAFANKEDADTLNAALTPTPYTPQTIRTKPQLLKHLEGVRRAGYATSDEERDQDVWGASVPLFQGGQCRHALSVVGPKFRLTEAKRAAIVAELLKAAADISRQLG
jgi:DNA-binding IclR family transcriptional regulator